MRMDIFFRWSLTFLLVLATTMECVQVILRYILEMPLMWLDETIIFPAIWMYMLGCANASREDTQIVAKILPVFFPAPRPVALFDFCARVFSLVISTWLTWYAVEYFFYSLETNRTTIYLFMPMYIGETAIAIGMLLITGYCLLHLSRSFGRLREIFGKDKNPC